TDTFSIYFTDDAYVTIDWEDHFHITYIHPDVFDLLIPNLLPLRPYTMEEMNTISSSSSFVEIVSPTKLNLFNSTETITEYIDYNILLQEVARLGYATLTETSCI